MATSAGKMKATDIRRFEALQKHFIPIQPSPVQHLTITTILRIPQEILNILISIENFAKMR